MDNNSNLLGEVEVNFGLPFDGKGPVEDDSIVAPEPGFDPITGEQVESDPQPAADPESAPIVTNEPEPTPEPEPESVADDSKYEDYSVAALLAIQAQESGYLPQDAEIGKDLEFDALMTSLYKNKDLELEKAKENYIAELDQYKEYVEMAINGGTNQHMSYLSNFDKVLAMDTESEENQRALLTYKYQGKGLNKSEIDNLVDDHITLGKGKEQANSFLEEVRIEKQNFIEAENQRLLEERKRDEQARIDAETKVKGIINDGKILNYNLNKREQRDLEEALYKPTEIFEYVDEQGNAQKTKVTKYWKLQNEMSRSPEMQLAVLKFMMDGYKMEGLETDIRNDINDEINAALAGKTISKPSRRNRLKTPPRNAPVIGSKFLGDINI